MTATPLPPPVLAPAVAARILALADDELVIGHRHSEWLGLSPFLEEDLTMASIAQDELGHARALYALIWPHLQERDALVMQRPADSYRSCNLVEIGALSWEAALVRHWLYDTAEQFRWDALATSPVLAPGLEELVPAVREEERFHRRHAVDLVSRLCAGSSDACNRIQHSLDLLWLDAVALLADEPELIPLFAAAVGEVADSLGLHVSAIVLAESDRGIRHPDFAAVHHSFVEVFGIDANATW